MERVHKLTQLLRLLVTQQPAVVASADVRRCCELGARFHLLGRCRLAPAAFPVDQPLMELGEPVKENVCWQRRHSCLPRMGLFCG